jgi:hypothetical protein
LGHRWSASAKSRNKQNNSNAVKAHDQIPDVCDSSGLSGDIVSKICWIATPEKVPAKSNI